MAIMGNKPKEGEDYYFNSSGLVVMTKKYLLKRGFCCGNGCFHCPYDGKKGSKTVKNS